MCMWFCANLHPLQNLEITFPTVRNESPKGNKLSQHCCFNFIEFCKTLHDKILLHVPKYHMHIYIIYYIYIWDSLRENCPSHIYMNCYKNASLLNRYIFRTVNAINVLISIFILHYFPIVKYILESCTCSVPVLQRSIPQRVQTRHNFL